MTTYKCRQFLLDALRKQPGLCVSEGTVRNNFNVLKQHGGAVLSRQNQFQTNSSIERHQQSAAAKFVIAHEAAALVKPLQHLSTLAESSRVGKGQAATVK